MNLLKIVTRVDKPNLLVESRSENVMGEARNQKQKKHHALDKQRILDTVPSADKLIVEENKRHVKYPR